MAHPFEVRKEIEVVATLEVIWEAIATGPGIDGWFLGTGNTVEERLGGRVVLDFGEASGESTITAWEPLRRFAHTSEAGPDGTLHAMEFEIEARAGGRVVIRLVHSGFLAGDWEAEYDAVNEGDFMYLHLLAQYVTHFRGRRTTLISLWRLDEPDRARALAAFRGSLGLGGAAVEGDPVRVAPEGIGPVEGVVDFVSRGIVGVRTGDALYRFGHSPQGIVFLAHHIYGDDIDVAAAKQAWGAWLDRAFA